jgi:hypothetical protein
MALYTLAVTAPAAFAAAASPDITVPFTPRVLILVNEDTVMANAVEFSFDGVEVHGKLIPGISGAIKLESDNTKVWFRRTAAALTVRLVASSKDMELGAGASDASGTGSTADQIQGNIAHDAVDSGNPVKTGGVASDVPSGTGAAVAVGDRVNQAMTLKGRAINVPAAMAGVKTQILAAGSAVDADNDWLSGGVIGLDGGAWRRLRLLLDLDAGAVGSQLGLIVLGAFTEAEPTAIADEWFVLATTDGTWTSQALTAAGAFPAQTAGAPTLPPNWFAATIRGSTFLSPAALNATDDLRLALPPIDVTGVRWFQVWYSQQDGGAALTLGLWYAPSL